MSATACGHWSNGGYCGHLETRRYITGWRCALHTPAALAGRPEPETLVDPECTLAALQAVAAEAARKVPVTFDAAHAVEFLDLVFGDVNSGRLSLSWLTPNGSMRSESFQSLRSGAARAQEWDAQHPPGIYFRVTMLPPEGVKSGRGGEADSHALPFLWADLDYGTVGHKPPPGVLLPPDEEAARKIIADLPTPSLIVHSGGGLYPIWRFDRPIYLDESNRGEARARSQQWQNLIKAASERLGWHYGSGVGDLARVLRLPGSINRKAGLERPCRVIEVSGEVLAW